METKKCDICNVRYKIKDGHTCDPIFLIELKEEKFKNEKLFKLTDIVDAIGQKIIDIHLNSSDYLSISLDNGKILLFQLKQDEYENTYGLYNVTNFPDIHCYQLESIGFYSAEECAEIVKLKSEKDKLFREAHERNLYLRLKAKFGEINAST